jgi:hypothetical protein
MWYRKGQVHDKVPLLLSCILSNKVVRKEVKIRVLTPSLGRVFGIVIPMTEVGESSAKSTRAQKQTVREFHVSLGAGKLLALFAHGK